MTAGGRVLQVPVSHRSEPMAAPGDALIGTAEHSVLGPRWVYDACADPVSLLPRGPVPPRHLS